MRYGEINKQSILQFSLHNLLKPNLVKSIIDRGKTPPWTHRTKRFCVGGDIVLFVVTETGKEPVYELTFTKQTF